MTQLAGTGDRDLAIEQANRARRISKVLRDDIERLAEALPEHIRADALAAADRFDLEAKSWDAAVAQFDQTRMERGA